MELERMNPEGDPEAPEEEKSDDGRGCCTYIDCNRFHETVSKWMLPEDNRGTYLERANCVPPPIFILAVSLAEKFVRGISFPGLTIDFFTWALGLTTFIYYAASKPQEQWITLDSSIWDSPFTYRPEKREEAWRFLSYMLVHAGIEHILGNLFLQLLLGIPLELVHKGLRVGLVYIAGVIGGSLASSVCDPLHGLVGASGGVYALIGGYFMNVLVNFEQMIPLFGVARLLFIFLIVGTDIGFALYRRFFSPPDAPMVSFVAHIAGGFAGISMGYVIFSNFDNNFFKDPRFWVSVIAYLVFVAFAVFFNVFFSPANK